jgi:predicted dinucleotide-binding enzyme
MAADEEDEEEEDEGSGGRGKGDERGKSSEGSSSASSGRHPGSIAKQIEEELVLDSIEVAAAFQTVPAKALMKEEEKLDADVPVACDDLYLR